MSKFFLFFSAVLLIGCAYNRIVLDLTDGVNRKEALILANEYFSENQISDEFSKKGVIRDGDQPYFTDKYRCAQGYWVASFTSRKILSLEAFYVLIEKQTGKVIRADKYWNMKCPQCQIFEGLCK